MLTTDEARLRYGDTAIVSHKGEFALVHLDQPDDRVLLERTEEFDPDDYFDPDCPLCDVLRDGCVVIFDEDDSIGGDSGEILLE